MFHSHAIVAAALFNRDAMAVQFTASAFVLPAQRFAHSILLSTGEILFNKISTGLEQSAGKEQWLCKSFCK
jgi:hypothetical protein